MKRIGLIIDHVLAFCRKLRIVVRFLGGMGMVAVMICGGITGVGWAFIWVCLGLLCLCELLVWLTRKT